MNNEGDQTNLKNIKKYLKMTLRFKLNEHRNY